MNTSWAPGFDSLFTAFRGPARFLQPFPPSRVVSLRSRYQQQQQKYHRFYSTNPSPPLSRPDPVSKHHGLSTFANLPWQPILSTPSACPPFDIAILGAPFDAGTTGRPGARFGPGAIRQASSRIEPSYSYSPYTGTNPFTSGLSIIDAGDPQLTTLDKTVALSQLLATHNAIASHTVTSPTSSPIPRPITLGGDHTTTLSALRSLSAAFGPLNIIHFDSHLDTWSPDVLGSESAYASLNHGTFLHVAHEENLLGPNSIHVGIRGPLGDPESEWENDRRCGFTTITARGIDRLGVDGVIQHIKARVGQSNVYISVDIDVLDPAFAPGTGTPEVGGWSTRELLAVIDGLVGVSVVGADVVEVAPAYDGPGEVTALAAAQVVVSLIGVMGEAKLQGKNR